MQVSLFQTGDDMPTLSKQETRTKSMSPQIKEKVDLVSEQIEPSLQQNLAPLRGHVESDPSDLRILIQEITALTGPMFPMGQGKILGIAFAVVAVILLPF